MSIGTKTIDIDGSAEFESLLERLSIYAEQELLLEGLTAAAQVVEAEALSLVLVKTGTLKKAIRIRTGRKRKGYLSIMVSIGSRFFSGLTYYGAFVEFGHKAGKRTSFAKDAAIHDTRKEVPGEHFLEIAAEEKSTQAIEAMLAKIKQGLEAFK